MKDFAQLTIATAGAPGARDVSSSSAPLMRSMTASSKSTLMGDPVISPRQSPRRKGDRVDPRPSRRGWPRRSTRQGVSR